MSGFTYKGIHSSQFGVDYIPDAAAKWWDDPEFDNYTKNVSWKNGGYWYGTNVKIREIKLSCYFEEISMATREKIRRWFSRGASGELVFDDRPFVYYIVQPKDVVSGKIYLDNNDTFSGTFTIKFIATEPFGYLMRKSNTGTEDDNASDYCALLPAADMPAAPTTAGRVFDVYNPGTEPCGLSIVLAGSAEKPIRFYNTRNNTVCAINELPSNGLYLDINGDTGAVEVYISPSGTHENGYAYHDYGIVRLDPDELISGVSFIAAANGTKYDIILDGMEVTEDMIGGHIQFDSPSTLYATVDAVVASENKLTCTIGGTGYIQNLGTCSICKRNHILIEEKNTQGSWVTPAGLTLSSIAIDYSPRIL